MTSRWQRSEVAFGPVGRVVATLVVIVPVLFAVFVNVMFLVAAVIWLFLLPTALRDIWRRSTVRVEDTMPSLGQADPPVPGTGIAERQAPVRW